MYSRASGSALSRLTPESTIKREAAFHEAGHAVAAHRSKFHAIVGPINLAGYGSGEVYISLSKRKLQANGKVASAAARSDKDVAADLAVVLAAGLVSERLAAAREPGLTPMPVCAVPDHELLRQELRGAGLPQELTSYEDTATQVLESEWRLVHDLAGYLFQHVSVDPDDILEFIEGHA